MEILRVPPYNTQVMIEVSLPSTEYDYVINDLSDGSSITASATSDTNRLVSLTLPSKYDGSYSVILDDDEHLFDVVRPYVDPNTKGSTASEIAAYAKNERLARAIIDSIIDDGFYFSKKMVETVGLGADYLPIWKNSKKLLKLYENNALVFDVENPDSYTMKYALTNDKFAVEEVYDSTINRNESAENLLPAGSSDALDLNYTYRGFPRGFDYKVVLEVGYKKIPSDIVLATEMLVEDIACGKLDYYKRYVSDYNTDQFKLKFDSGVFDGTGNLVVDKILSKYHVPIRTIGVL